MSNKEDMDRFEMKKIIEARKIANDERYKNQSKNTLSRHIEAKLRTTMIGALARFEENFGVLWGHGKRDSDLSEREERYRELWNLTRTEVLNNGNNQLRAAKEEICCYTIMYNKFETEFILKQDNQELTQDE